MPIISKIDNELTQLLKAQITFLTNPETTGSISFRLEDGDIGDYLDEKTLVRGLEDIHDLKLLMAEKEFLNSEVLGGRLKKNFVSYFDKNPYLKAEVIKEEDKITDIKVTGNLVDLILVEYPLTALLNELIVIGQIREEQINADAFLTEGVRRIQLKADLASYTDNFKIYMGGCRDRVSYEWFTVVVTALSGYLREKIVGINHLMSAFVYGLPVEGYLTEDMWADQWDKKDIAPSLAKYTADWSGVLATKDDFNGETTPGGTILFREKSPYEVLHFLQHGHDRDIIIEWDEGFARDLGVNFKKLQITKKISKKS